MSPAASAACVHRVLRAQSCPPHGPPRRRILRAEESFVFTPHSRHHPSSFGGLGRRRGVDVKHGRHREAPGAAAGARGCARAARRPGSQSAQGSSGSFPGPNERIEINEGHKRNDAFLRKMETGGKAGERRARRTRGKARRRAARRRERRGAERRGRRKHNTGPIMLSTAVPQHSHTSGLGRRCQR